MDVYEYTEIMRVTAVTCRTQIMKITTVTGRGWHKYFTMVTAAHRHRVRCSRGTLHKKLIIELTERTFVITSISSFDKLKLLTINV